MTDLTEFLSALADAADAARPRFVFAAAPGGGDAGDIAWIAEVADEYDDAGQVGGAAPGRLPQTVGTTVRVDAVFDAETVGLARARQADLLRVVSAGARTTRRWRIADTTLTVDRGAARRFGASVTAVVYNR